MSDGTRFRQGYDVLMDRLPDPPAFEDIVSLDAHAPDHRRFPNWAAATGVAAMSLVALAAIALFNADRPGPADATVPTTPTAAPDDHQFGTPVFDEELPWTLVFDNGYDRVKAIDLDQGIPYESVIEGGAPGDQPFRLTEVDGHLIVGWGTISAYDLETGESRSIGEATLYVPAAEDGRVWMIDYPGARISDQPPEVWQVTSDGQVVNERKNLGVAAYDPIGFPGGLILKTDEGLKVWDYQTGEVIQTFGSELSFVSDASSSGLIAWCSEPCDQMQVSNITGDTRTFRHPSGDILFSPGNARFSPDGRFLAAPAGREVVVIDLRADTVQPLTVFDQDETMFVNWAPAGADLYVSTYSYGERSMSIAHIDALTGDVEVVDLPFGGTLDFVVLPTDDAETLLGFECPVTIPTQSGFLAPEPWPSYYRGADNVFWYGTDDLWTALPIRPADYGQRKSVWWSANFPGGGIEEKPEITVYWRRLDLTSPVISQVGGTNAYTSDDGWFMIAGIDPETPGCWQVTATYKGTTLSYVYDNR